MIGVPRRAATAAALPSWSAASLLALRRAWRDRWLVAASVAVVALAALLAYAGPRTVLGTIDDGVADAVEAAGPAAQVSITFPLGNPGGNNLDSVRGLDVAVLDATVNGMTNRLPKGLATALGAPTVSATSTSYPLTSLTTAADISTAQAAKTDPEATARNDANITFAVIPGASMTASDGDLPLVTAAQGPQAEDGPDPEPLQVAMTPAVANALGVGIGDELTVDRAGSGSVRLLVTGLVSIADPDGTAQTTMPTLFATQTSNEGTAQERVNAAVLLTPDAAAAFTSLTETPFDTQVTYPVIEDRLTMALARTIPHEVDRLEVEPERLVTDANGNKAAITPRVETDLGKALEGYPVRARAALAQMSVLIAGVVATAAAVIVLMARLLLAGRRRDIALERARGASVISTAVTLAIESTLVTAIGVGIALVAASIVSPGFNAVDPLVGIVAAVSLCATPVWGAVTAKAMWSAKREGANRSDRAKAASARRVRALTRDFAVVFVAALAVIALRSRGVAPAASTGVDPFMSLGPVLVSAAVTLVALRVLPVPMRLAQAIARRTRGTAGLLALARARQSVAALPVFALALAISVAASGSLLTSTVSAGQDKASWERIGAQVRIDQALSPAVADRLERQGTVVSQAIVMPYATIALGQNLDNATVMAVDASFADVLDEAGMTADASAIRDLVRRSTDLPSGAALPALASSAVSDLDVYGRSDVFVGKTYIPFDIVGPAISAQSGWLKGPYVIVCLDALLTVTTQEPVAANTTLLGSADAAAMVDGLGIDPSEVHTRQAWLADAKGSALIGGVERVMTLAIGAVAALAAVALVVGVVTGSRERSRALALLRTQGVGAGYGWWLAFTDLLPAVGTAIVAGAMGAGAVVALLARSLGLDVLAGGIEAPALSLNLHDLAWGAIVIAVLMAGAIIAEVAVQRRAKLSEVLRYGELR